MLIAQPPQDAYSDVVSPDWFRWSSTNTNSSTGLVELFCISLLNKALSHWSAVPGFLFSVVLHSVSSENSARQSMLAWAHKVPNLSITTGAPGELLPPFPLPKDCSTPLPTVHDDGDSPEPHLGDSGHVPLPPTDRFELCLYGKFFFNFPLCRYIVWLLGFLTAS